MMLKLVCIALCFGAIYAPPMYGLARYVKGSEGYCSFSSGDYKPNDPSMVELNRLPVPKLQMDILNKVATISGEVGRHAAAGMHGINLLKATFGEILPETFVKSAPILAPILGVVGAAMGFKVASNDDSKAKLLRNTRDALEKLSLQVDRKFDNFQHYVEGNFIREQKEDALDELNEIFESFVNCADRHDDEAIDRCNREKSFAMDEKRGKFMFSESEFERSEHLDILQTKKMEATLQITRDYVFKYLLTLQNYFVREQLLEANDLHYFDVFSKKIMDRIPIFIRYIRWAYNEIERTHTTGNCDDIQCGSFVRDSEGNDVKRCTCHMDKTDMTRLCTVILKYSQSPTDQERKSGAGVVGQKSLERRKDIYKKAIKTEIENVWRKEILDQAASWENTVREITESRENYPNLGNDDDESGSGSEEDKYEGDNNKNSTV